MPGEIDAIKKIDEAMSALEADVAKRVLRWAVDKFGEGSVAAEGTGKGGRGTSGDNGAGSNAGDEGGSPGSFERISDLMDAASPTTIVEYVLLGGYWFQQLQGAESVTGQEVNAQLKDLGHGSKNITDSFTSLIRRKPPLARQVQKTGSTRQARKRYRLTTEGIRYVENMLSGRADD